MSKRTVERDLNDLSAIFPLTTTIGSPPIGWRWLEGAVQELPGLDLVESLSLSLVGDLLSQTFPPSLHPAITARVAEARQKLAALPGYPTAAWSQLARYIPPGQALLAPKVDAGVLDLVEQSLVHRRQLAVSYLSAIAGHEQEFHLHPIALLSHGPTPYLLASFGKDDDLRQYPLHRFQSAELLENPSHRPDDFNLDTFLAEGGATFGGQKAIRLEATVGPDLANILRETPLSEDQVLREEAGVTRLKATVTYSWQLVFYLLSQGPRITILKPLSLRNEILENLTSALANY